MTRRQRRLLPLALIAFTACAGEPERRVRFDDFVAHPERAEASAGVAAPATIYCGDETHYAYTLEDGASLDVPLELGRDGRLVLSGCLSHPSQTDDIETGVWRISAPVTGDGAGPARVTWRLRHDGAPGAEIDGGLDAAADASWWRREIDLAAWPDEAAAFHLEVELPPGRRLYLKDLYLEHQVVDPPRTVEIGRAHV